MARITSWQKARIAEEYLENIWHGLQIRASERGGFQLAEAGADLQSVPFDSLISLILLFRWRGFAIRAINVIKLILSFRWRGFAIRAINVIKLII